MKADIDNIVDGSLFGAVRSVAMGGAIAGVVTGPHGHCVGWRYCTGVGDAAAAVAIL